ncbi:MAG: D-alanyl-D-alanine carboxypeptidase [Firmicutes bacterium]|nr:D-alanyl-D-alanine carboxypeptidase [Bacillota bacterium]
MKRFFKTILTMAVALTLAAGAAETAAAASGPDLEGTGAVVYCETTDEIIWEKNADKKYNLASITKLMTCLIAAEELGLDTVVTVDKEATNVKKGESVVFEGEKITVENLIYESLLVSANDAAKALAIAVSGSEEEFAKLMNERAAAIGCTKTKFLTASGVWTESGHGASARDVALIAAEALNNADIRRIAGTSEYTVPATNKNTEPRLLESSNLFLKGGEAEWWGQKFTVEAFEGVFGGKTGTTNKNKTTMVVGCDFDGLEVYVVTLNSTPEKRYTDIKKLLDYAKENVQRYDAFKKGDLFEEGSLLGGATNKVVGMAAEDGIINLPEGASASLITVTAIYDENLYAPIAKGQVIGKLNIYMADEVVRTLDLVASEDVKEGWFLSKWGITNLQTIIIIGAAVLVIGTIVLIISMRIVNKKRREAERKARLRRMVLKQMEQDLDHRQRNWPY